VKSKRFLIGLLGGILFVSSPFLLSYIYNEYLRLNFQSGLYEKIKKINNGYFRVIALESRVYQVGNTESCGYSVTMVFKSMVAGKLLSDFSNIKVLPARKYSQAEVDFYAYNFGNLYVVIALDEGYSPLFDLRCF
jgi:hypothetical protein